MTNLDPKRLVNHLLDRLNDAHSRTNDGRAKATIDLLIQAVQLAADDMLSTCAHPRAKRVGGPRTALVYGSAPTQVCTDCGSWRTMHHYPGRWRPAADLLEALERDDD
jgi:hypothetical protein